MCYYVDNIYYISIQFSSVTRSCPALCDPMVATCQVSLSITNSQSLLKLISIELVMPSNHLFLCHPLLLLPSVSPSVRVFSNELALQSFSFSIRLTNGYSGLISFRIDWFDLLPVQGTLKSLRQQHSSIQFGAQSSLWSNSHIHT